MTSSLAIRLDFGDAIVNVHAVAHAVAGVLGRPCFSELSRLSGRRRDRWSKHVSPSVETIAKYLTDETNDAISLDTKRGGELVASAEIENGIGREAAPVFATRLIAYVVIPFVPAELETVIVGVCDLAVVLHAAAGFIALEPSYGLAQRAALHASRPKERMGVSEQRFRERRARNFYADRIASELAGVEWGTFLGPGHLHRIDLGELRRSGAFERIVEVTPQLALLQVTSNPMDDLTAGIESKLAAARVALAPVLMDVSAISLE